MGNEHFQVTLWSKNITRDGENHYIESKYDIEKHPYFFKAFDDDDVFYCAGTADSIDYINDVVSDKLASSYGVTLVNVYARTKAGTGRVFAAIG